MAKKVKRPKPYRWKAFGILNPHGDVWTVNTFDTEAEAQSHLEHFWTSVMKVSDHDLSKYRIVPVRITVSAIQTAG